MFRVVVVGIVLFCSSIAIAKGQDALVKLLTDPAHQRRVIDAAGRSTVLLQNPCPSATFDIERRFVVYKQPTFDNLGGLGDGAWKQIVDEDGCGVRRVLNVLVSAQGPMNVTLIPLLPGSTHADPVLQRDAVGYALAALSTVPAAHEPDCAVGYVADTEFLQQEGDALPGAKGPPWRERWTLITCTKRALVPMRFIPDSTGTSISAGPTTAIELLPLSEGSH